jgi:hypothetical protein
MRASSVACGADRDAGRSPPTCNVQLQVHEPAWLLLLLFVCGLGRAWSSQTSVTQSVSEWIALTMACFLVCSGPVPCPVATSTRVSLFWLIAYCGFLNRSNSLRVDWESNRLFCLSVLYTAYKVRGTTVVRVVNFLQSYKRSSAIRTVILCIVLVKAKTLFFFELKRLYIDIVSASSCDCGRQKKKWFLKPTDSGKYRYTSMLVQIRKFYSDIYFCNK